MRDGEFKAWLAKRGARTEAGRNTRAHAVRTIEKNLAALGSPYSDLEAAWAGDRFEHLRQRLKELRENFSGGGSEFRVLMPQSVNPRHRLASWRSWLSQYGHFLDGGTVGERDADRIRAHVLESYIEPARCLEKEFVEVVVRDVNRELGLNQAWPNICQALTGTKFLEMADVILPERIGADQSPATIFRFHLNEVTGEPVKDRSKQFVLFDASGRAFQPTRTYNRATERSAYRIQKTGTSNRTADAEEVDTIAEVARAMLIDGRLARVKAIDGTGPANYVGYGKRVLVRYELDPTIASELGIPARSELPHEVSLNLDALERLRLAFQARFPDFANFDESGEFASEEDDCKRALIDRAAETIASAQADSEIVTAAKLLDLLANRSDLESNLLGWRMANNLARVRERHPGAIEAAVARLVTGADAVEAVSDFVAEAWPLLSEGQSANLPYGDSRTIPTMLAALLHPDAMIGMRYQPIHNAGIALLGRPLFANAPLSKDEVRDVLAMSRSIFAVMRDEWGWRPRDLWDVQGFIWVTCQNKLGPSKESVADETEPLAECSVTTNLILYGPPGTGKTYASAREAVRLCGEEPPADRGVLMQRYRALSDAGRIEFVTFHQSMAYEDFVEGLRPSSVDEDGQPLASGFRLVPTPGIFRRIARRAETSTGSGSANFSIGDRRVFKMSLGEVANPDDAYLFEEAISEGRIILGFENIDWSDPKFADRDEIIAACRAALPGDRDLNAQSGVVQMPHIFRNWMKVGDVVIVSKGTKLFRAIGIITGEYRYAPRDGGDYSHQRDVKWLWVDPDGAPVEEIYARGFSMRTTYAMYAQDLNIPALERYANSQSNTDRGAPEPFVLVIDEINRANISKVFGELITLLEPDKRLGRTNALKVRLPYSGDLFGVPANLHIIGTMNTADRSIALIDKALRRRFTFSEMMPDYSVAGMKMEVADAGVTLEDVLRTLNDRIEYLLDREHQIGHGWLLGCTTKSQLDAAMRDKVIPLIAEYFFEDWGRTADVLGGRDNNPFLKADELPPPSGLNGEEKRYRWLTREAFDADAYRRLIGRV